MLYYELEFGCLPGITTLAVVLPKLLQVCCFAVNHLSITGT